MNLLNFLLFLDINWTLLISTVKMLLEKLAKDDTFGGFKQRIIHSGTLKQINMGQPLSLRNKNQWSPIGKWFFHFQCLLSNPAKGPPIIRLSGREQVRAAKVAGLLTRLKVWCWAVGLATVKVDQKSRKIDRSYIQRIFHEEKSWPSRASNPQPSEFSCAEYKSLLLLSKLILFASSPLRPPVSSELLIGSHWPQGTFKRSLADSSTLSKDSNFLLVF